jgi:hypothetical protein
LAGGLIAQTSALASALRMQRRRKLEREICAFALRYDACSPSRAFCFRLFRAGSSCTRAAPMDA